MMLTNLMMLAYLMMWTYLMLAYLHDVGLVNCCHFTSVVLHGIVKSKLGNSLGVFPGDDFQTLNNTRYCLSICMK